MRPSWTTRIWWLLKLYGFDGASVLDGGWEKWVGEGRPLFKVPGGYPPAEFEVDPRPWRLASIDSTRLFAAAEGLIEQSGLRGHTYYQMDASLYEGAMAAVRSSLGDSAFRDAQEEGRSMPISQAIEYALVI